MCSRKDLARRVIC
ncbi:hypothetical protein F383_35434 [Gossypium arboreum]|uniref:Uncharacterized protein n=1 Tax=Gossypium arboreum TaxID=29729 RepID=A0A0B0N9P5_GOSAR|nr:hypothetical protein F383_35434 [Gossypium arboreum]